MGVFSETRCLYDTSSCGSRVGNVLHLWSRLFVGYCFTPHCTLVHLMHLSARSVLNVKHAADWGCHKRWQCTYGHHHHHNILCVRSTTCGHQFISSWSSNVVVIGDASLVSITRVVNIWNFLPNDVVNFSTLSSFKNSHNSGDFLRFSTFDVFVLSRQQ